MLNFSCAESMTELFEFMMSSMFELDLNRVIC